MNNFLINTQIWGKTGKRENEKDLRGMQNKINYASKDLSDLRVTAIV